MDIEFGNIRQSAPQVALPPDQDGQFAVMAIGNPRSNELRIFVDLDVMRDMEAHARSNQKVELGGVLLGRQQIDPTGQPFVHVFECLQAKHYEATKGSFKFTHDTWSQITRDRANFRADLEMVGWYHTHPGWSVFLSGMDLFICNHFFNRPLDVALVIDPCNDDRGWFQWNDALAGNETLSTAQPMAKESKDGSKMGAELKFFDGQDVPSTPTEASNPPGELSPRSTRQTNGFFLTTGRLRKQELEYFASIYNKHPLINRDPRYSDHTMGADSTMVNFIDNRKPVFEIALAAMMFMQFVLVALIAWKLISTSNVVSPSQLTAELEHLAAKIEDSSTDPIKQPVTQREKVYQEILSAMVAAQTGDPGLVDEFAELKIDHQQLASHLKAQTALATSLEERHNQLIKDLDKSQAQNEQLTSQLQTMRQQLGQAREELQAIAKSESRLINQTSQIDASKAKTNTENPFDLPWWLAWIAGLGVLSLGGGLGFFLARRTQIRSMNE